MAAIEVNAPDLPGILVDVGTTRIYPNGEQLAHVVGYVAPPIEADVADDPDLALPGIRVGRAGLEKEHDLDLRGTAGVVQLEVNALGRVIRELDRQEGTPGEELGLTIDAVLQQTVLRRLGNESCSAVVLDCRNGEVLAMGTNPSFDPSLFNSGVSQAQWAEWSRDKRTPLLNRAIAGVYAPGSTFKMAVAMAGLEARIITPGDVVHCPGYLDLGNARFHCWRKDGHGSLDLRGGIKNSCDVYFYETARRVGIDRIAAMSHRFGLGTELEIDLPGARPGFMPTREWRIGQGHPWNLGDTVVSGIGQGYIQVTPLQLAVYAARVATGRKVEPHLTRKLAGVLQPGSQPADWPSLGLSERSLHIVREGMWAVVNEAGRHRAGGKAARPALADGGQDRFVAGAAGVARAARAGPLRQLQAALGIPPARAVRRLRAVRRAALCAVGGGGARQRRRRGGRADRARHHDRRAAARPGRTRRTAAARRSPSARRTMSGDEGRAAVARDLVRSRRQGLAGQLAVCGAALRAGRHRLRRAVQRRGRCAGAVRRAPCAALRRRPGADDRHRAGRYPLHRAAGLAELSGLAGAAGAGDALRPCRQGRAALDRPGRTADPAVGADEDRAGAGAGVVVPPRVVGADRQSAVPDRAGHRGAGAGRC